MFVGAHLPLDVVGGYALGFTVAALGHLAAGAPSGRITADQVRAALSRAGIAVASVRPAKVDARGVDRFFAEKTDGDGLFVKAVGPDQRDADVLFKTYRFVAYRGLDDEKPFRSAKRQIEVEALLDLLAAKAGVRTPAVVALAELEDGTTLLAHEGLTASGLDTADPARLTDTVLKDLWAQVATLHGARLVHRDLRLANVMVDEAGCSWLVDFGFAEAAASDRALHRDIAELLASQATTVPPERAVDAAIDEVGAEQVVAALPYIATAGLAGATRTALKAMPGRLDELRRVAAQRVGAHAVPGVVRPDRSPGFARGAGRGCTDVRAAGAAGQQQGRRHAGAGPLGPADPNRSRLRRDVPRRGRGAPRRGRAAARWARTLLVTVASSYANRAAPAAIGRTALDVEYLRAAGGLTEDEAVEAVATGSAAGVVVHAIVLVLVAVGVLVAPHAARGAFDTTAGVIIALFVVLMALAAGWSWGDRARLQQGLRDGARGLRAAVRDPGRGVRLFAGSALVTLGYAVAFVGATLTMIAHTAGLGAALVYLTALPVAVLLPVPGGVVVLDVVLVLGELVNGATLVPAIVAVLLFRTITYWLTVWPAWLAYRRVTAAPA